MTANDAADVADQLEREFGFRLAPVERERMNRVHRPRFNVAPGQRYWLLRGLGESVRVTEARWGIALGTSGRTAINARAESLVDKPSFAVAAERGRAVVVADGFFEWDANRHPWWFTRPDGRAMLLAAICRRAPDNVPKFATLTIPANRSVARIHDRMPSILDGDPLRAWLGDEDARAATEMIRAAPELRLDAVPVSRHVNDPGHDDPRCIEVVPEPAEQRGLFTGADRNGREGP
jgi:putative SOS response-associated peptidase YedK